MLVEMDRLLVWLHARVAMVEQILAAAEAAWAFPLHWVAQVVLVLLLLVMLVPNVAQVAQLLLLVETLFTHLQLQEHTHHESFR
jgi:hypothetical protein